jgi:carboxyl-terminal processing protease
MPRRNFTILILAALVSLACYQRATRNRYTATLTEAMNLVAANYVSEVDSRVLFEGALKGMVKTLDPYSGYTSRDEYSQFQEQLDGEFVGVGIRFDHDEETGRLNVAEALVGKPAFLAGIRAGDAIVAIDGRRTSEVELREAVRMIRGKAGTSVRLTVEHPGRVEEAEYTLVRTTIPLETVLGDARTSDGRWVYRLAGQPRIGYIRIFDNFGERTAEEFRQALATYREEGQQIDGLIIDLRYNRGGLLDTACEVCDALLDGGTIVTTRGRHGKVLDTFTARAGVDLPEHVPIVVLVDRLSASASEIVAAALQDTGRAVVAGQRSWGKGSVQNVLTLEGGRSAIRLTVGSYHRPSGKDIHKWQDAKETDDWGVRPDPGLEVLLTNKQNDLIILARRKRDFLKWDELVSIPPSGPPVPEPDPESEPPATEEAALLDREATLAAGRDPGTIDPQLQIAIEHLTKR